ncbi:MAG: hypothetical protein V4478_03360 [Patescibacteria group bacterium]
MADIVQKKNRLVETYKYGVISTLEPITIPPGAAQDSLNWLTMGDHIELRRGFEYIGTESVNEGVGKATGLRKVVLASGAERIFGSYGKKAKYFDDVTTNEWVEIGTDILGNNVVDADGIGKESVSFEEYVGLAGNQLFINSTNIGGYYKVMVANPTDYTNMYDSAKNKKGLIKIDNNRTLLWQTLKDQTGLNGSYIDTQAYVTVASESIGTGDGAAVTFTGTLAFRAANPVNTAFGISVTDGVETFTDDFNGILIGSLGGTGTINYTTGAISVTFATAPAGAANIDASYQHENSNTHGITDFTKSPTRLAGEGFIIRQDAGGGKFQTVKSYNNVYYCLHIKRSWALSISSDDSSVNNQPYRHKVGIPNDRAAVETGEGVYYIDETDENDTRIRLLTYDTQGSTQVLPVPISNKINLNRFTWDNGACGKYGDFIYFGGREKTSLVNNRTLVYNKLYSSWDILDYSITCSDTYLGALIAGDGYSDNFMTLFSGLDDIGSPIFNYWVSGEDQLGLDGLKKSKKFKVRGDIGPDQSIKLSVSLDNGPFVELRTTSDIAASTEDRVIHAIEGDGTYVDRGNRVTVGPRTLGRGEVGGGGDGIEAYRFEREIAFPFDKFETATLKVEATRLGWASLSLHGFMDVRFKGVKTPRKYRG